MSSVESVELLKVRHAELEVAIGKEEKKPHPDDLNIHELKKRKLQIKDKLLQMGAS